MHLAQFQRNKAHVILFSFSVTTPAYSSNSYTSPPECEVKVINFSRVDGLAGASSQMSGAKAVQALKGSNGFWSPTTDDVETYPYLFFQVIQ
ncbi:hypothetical protein DPMN_105645 [Dreissena polymorpha]|uniref:Uncharacterized protein n=1 Tax=Dreissena polymorpha TaxID=45954 RepID=A0A9D4IS85_DREPO|nr:hypothetical protein DPMN_160995 [Dreissena polymorpha]KAH3832360.1 hypothetical protein DPMN_105645 [Dreissena polymorpha]